MKRCSTITSNGVPRALLSGADLSARDKRYYLTTMDDKEFTSYRFVKYLGKVYDLHGSQVLSTRVGGFDFVSYRDKKMFVFFKFTEDDRVIMGHAIV